MLEHELHKCQRVRRVTLRVTHLVEQVNHVNRDVLILVTEKPEQRR